MKFSKHFHPVTMIRRSLLQAYTAQEKVSLFDWIYKLSRWGIGGIFIYAGSIKLLAPDTVVVLIDAFGVIPEPLILPVSISLPALEVAAGIGLLVDIEGSLAVIAGLLGIFAAVLGYGIWIGLDVDCGCFGPEDPEALAFHGLRASLYRDLVMLAGIVLVYGLRWYRSIKPLKIKYLFAQR